MHQALAEATLSREKPLQQRQRHDPTEPEPDQAVCGDSTPMTAPESKCKSDCDFFIQKSH